VAFAFCDNPYSKGIEIEIHHKDKNKKNNFASNLCILSADEHRKEHSQKEKGAI
jgi:hypothetical protein